MVGLQLLKHTCNVSDEEVVATWVENPYWQYFCCEQYFRHDLPIDPSLMTGFRKRIGEAGCEFILGLTLSAGLATKTVAMSSLAVVNVDTTVQEKAIAHPVDSRLLEIARHKVASAAKRCGIALKQTFAKEGKELRRKAGGYAHAKQFRRLRRTVKRQCTILGALMRDAQRGLLAEVVPVAGAAPGRRCGWCRTHQ